MRQEYLEGDYTHVGEFGDALGIVYFPYRWANRPTMHAVSL